MSIAPVIKLIPKYKKTGEVTDLGVGDGDNALFLAERGFKVTAVDKDQAKVHELKQKAIVEKLQIIAKQADLAKIEFAKKYDVIVATMVLHFFKKPAITKIIKKLKTATKKGRLNVVSVYTDKNTNGSRPYLFAKDELRQFYSDWPILHYWEGLGKPFKNDSGKFIRKYRAEIIAEKK